MAAKKKAAGKSAEKASSKPGAVQELEQILELMGRHQVAELEWDRAGSRIHLKTQTAFSGQGGAMYGYPQGMPMYGAPQMNAPMQAFGGPGGQSGAAPSSAPSAAQVAEDKAAAAAAANTKQVMSPFVGTFYRSATPGAESYVREGQVVKAGDVLCIVEAMKLMNEIEAEFPGKIIQVLVENGQPVEFGEPLFVIQT